MYRTNDEKIIRITTQRLSLRKSTYCLLIPNYLHLILSSRGIKSWLTETKPIGNNRYELVAQSLRNSWNTAVELATGSPHE